MKAIVIKNQELDEPYCFRENGSLMEYHPDHVLDCWVSLTEEGYVYVWENGKIVGDPIDESQNWEDWVRMVGDPDYPSAKMIG